MEREIRLNNSEMKLMQLLWQREESSAKELSLAAAEAYGWNKNTTYTILKGLVAKEYVSRSEPGFICKSCITVEETRRQETRGLIDRLFGGSPQLFFSSFLQDETLSDQEYTALRRLIDKENDKEE